jgi:hypothetical protein
MKVLDPLQGQSPERLTVEALIKQARGHQRRRRLLLIGIIAFIAVVVSGISYAVVSRPSARAPRTGTSLPTRTVSGSRSHSLMAYVLNPGAGTVTPINTVTNRAGKPIKVGRAYAQYIGFSLDASTVYVGRDNGLSARVTVIPIHVATNRVGTPISWLRSRFEVADWGCATTVATTPNGKTDYLSVPSEGVVVPINVRTSVSGKPIRVGSGASAIIIVN